MNSIFINFTGNKDRHKISDGFEFRLDLVSHFGVTCPWAVKENDVSSFSRSLLIRYLSNLVPTKSYVFYLVGAGAFLPVAWPTRLQLLVFFCSSVSVVLFDTPGISRCRSQHVILSSPHVYFTIELICDLFVSRDDLLMSKWAFTRTEQLYV